MNNRARLRRSKSAFDMNKAACFHTTRDVMPSRPLHHGAYDRYEDAHRLRSSYSMFHGPKVTLHDRGKAIASKPSSMRLLAGTNDFAEDLTGQQAPLNASNWRSETKFCYDGKVHRPSTASGIPRIISQMNNQAPIFGSSSQRKNQFLEAHEMNPSQHLHPSRFRESDMYHTSYSLDHRPFTRDEKMASSYWNREKNVRPWLQEPVTAAAVANFQLKCREPEMTNENTLYPTEAQLATLPHYNDPHLTFGRSEVQVQFKDPYTAENFYFEEPNKVQKGIPPHLQKTFVN